MLHRDMSPNEIRVIGCLMEKAKLTPDTYPLTLNALTNACNQKSSRDPVMNLSQGVVQHTARELEKKHLLHVEENFRRGVEKYSHRFCNTTYGELKFNSAQYAIICLLLLRGPQTPGELRAHSGRLHEFADNQAVVEVLATLMQRDGDPLVVQLPRTPGRKDSEYMHLFAGDIDVEAYAEEAQSARATSTSSRGSSMADLENRVSELERELSELKKLLQ
jgi:uncharacterized protein YceH (UPF0502 family)